MEFNVELERFDSAAHDHKMLTFGHEDVELEKVDSEAQNHKMLTFSHEVVSSNSTLRRICSALGKGATSYISEDFTMAQRRINLKIAKN